MIANRHSSAALLKSKIDFLDIRLKEVEANAASIRAQMLHLIKEVEQQSKPVTVSLMSALVAATQAEPDKPLLKKQIIKPPRIKVVKVRQPLVRGRKTVFTDDVMAQIPGWLASGLRREDIAEKIGCTLGSLVATCCKRGISLRSKGLAPKVVYHHDYEAA